MVAKPKLIGAALPPGAVGQVYRTGGAYSLTKAFKLLDISPSYGHALIKAEKIKIVRLGPGSPRITDAEIERLLTHGIEGQIDGYAREMPIRPNPRSKGKASLTPVASDP
jgi:hypothetical protein